MMKRTKDQLSGKADREDIQLGVLRASSHERQVDDKQCGDGWQTDQQRSRHHQEKRSTSA